MPKLKVISRCIPVLFIALAAGSASGADSTVSCKEPPKEGASVAVHDGTTVSKTQDHQKNTCTFSINGAVATSPPPQQVIDALNVFRDPSKRFIASQETAASTLAALMAASAPVDEVPKEIVEVLLKLAQPLKQCLEKFFSNQEFPTERSEINNFLCRGIKPYEGSADKARSLAEFEIAAGGPALAISLGWASGRFTSTVLLPRAMSGQPALRVQ